MKNTMPPPRAAGRGRFGACMLVLAPLLVAPTWSANAMSDTPPAQDARERLRAQGIDFELVYTGEIGNVLSGGVRRESNYFGLAQATITADGSTLGVWPGATAHLHLIRPHGSDPGDDVGDAQGVSNIAATAHGRILEAWLQQNLLDNRISLLAGRYDLNSEFYQLQSAGLFMNSSFGIGPEVSQTGLGGPSLYPDTALAARVEVRPSARLVLRGAVLNGVPVGVSRPDGGTGIRRSGDGLLYVGEASLIWPASDTTTAADGEVTGHRRTAGRAAAQALHDSKIALGAWRYEDAPSGLDGDAATTDGGGVYLVGERTLLGDAGAGGRRLRAFGQLGLADGDSGRFSRYFGAGLALNAPFASRPHDEAGIAMARAENSNRYRDAARAAGTPADAAETAIELTYLARFNSQVMIQPGLQYVINPDTDPARADALVLLLRFQLAL